MNSQFKLIALDIDGTLVTNQQQITNRTWQILQQVKESGIQIILVTGRHHMMARSVYKTLNLDTPIICANGAYIYSVKKEEIIEGSCLSSAQKFQLLPLIEKFNFDVIAYFTDGIGYQPDNHLVLNAKNYFDNHSTEMTPNFCEYPQLNQLLTIEKDLWKIDLIHKNELAVDAFIEEITTEHAIEFHRTSKNGIEIMNQKNSKGIRLTNWVVSQGFCMSEVIAFGDNQNDISMLTQVGLSVAMGNATESVKQSSHMITKTNEEDGIAEVLSDIFQIY